MITLLNTNMNLLKEEMRTAKVIKTFSKSVIGKRCKNDPIRLEREIKRNDLLNHMYSESKTIPVKIGDSIINYKFLSSYLKKLKNHTVEIKIGESSILISYEKGQSKGQLMLEDLSCYFQNFKHIPVAVIDDGSET
ncbi:hypothetical protein [Heyndrickxia oleronia]|uniref:hypothetical protein n=1 Tax=Heyndrickxia oleronia TaxID=38875 RepID=UPI001B0E9880|nr:hypothetical protein [Heyndrickxia oleronia]GIN37816.1 hypothetical protein J19TS1_07650 [Heyndrickxia oleronia]